MERNTTNTAWRSIVWSIVCATTRRCGSTALMRLGVSSISTFTFNQTNTAFSCHVTKFVARPAYYLVFTAMSLSFGRRLATFVWIACIALVPLSFARSPGVVPGPFLLILSRTFVILTPLLSFPLPFPSLPLPFPLPYPFPFQKRSTSIGVESSLELWELGKEAPKAIAFDHLIVAWSYCRIASRSLSYVVLSCISCPVMHCGALGNAVTFFFAGCCMAQRSSLSGRSPFRQLSKVKKSSRMIPASSACYVKQFFCLDAAWLNEVRCPGGRPSVS